MCGHRAPLRFMRIEKVPMKDMNEGIDWVINESCHKDLFKGVLSIKN